MTTLADELEALAAKATAGPLVVIHGSEPGDDHRNAIAATRGKYSFLVATIENGAPGDCCDTEVVNAELFTMLHNHLPTIIASLRATENNE